MGVRNILIDNLKPLKDRSDVGQLWENLLISERMKYLSYTQNYGSMYFWRVYTGAELDLVEEKDGMLNGYELKFGKKSVKAPKGWRITYPKAKFTFINKENYLKFITGK